MELKSYQNNSFSAEDISIDMSQNNKKLYVPSFSNNSAIKLTDVSLTFGKNKVLEGLNMTVPYGKICSIIGPKNSGKTLVFQSIVGLVKPSEGVIEVFGRKPEYSSSIGYMPEEISLFDDLTINEIMKYFGQLYNLPNNFINNKLAYLIESLTVNDKNILIRCLNNNDKVAVSLAVTILHSPQLLILDEPTLYGDPLFKKIIQKQLRNLCDRERVTILISSSHIEEAQHSDIVGLIRDGTLIAEELPQRLVKEISYNSVEDIFLNLFNKNKFKEINGFSKIDKNLINNNNKTATSDNSFHEINLNSNVKQAEKIKTSSIGRISALYYKNLKSKLRNRNLLIFQLLYPAFAIALFCFCIGKNPYDIPVGVYNPDRPSLASDLILKYIDNKTISLKYYNTFESAIHGIREHEVWAVLSFPHNYTRSMLERSLQVRYQIIFDSIFFIFHYLKVCFSGFC